MGVFLDLTTPVNIEGELKYLFPNRPFSKIGSNHFCRSTIFKNTGVDNPTEGIQNREPLFALKTKKWLIALH